MKVTYFSDTDTALLQFSDQVVSEVLDLGENTLLELDAKGNPVSITVEHAAKLADFPDVVVERASRRVP
jgi:uncharacterized protein YuzE